MKTKSIITVFTLSLSVFLFASCSKKPQGPNPLHDANCAIGAEKLAVDGTYIGPFSLISEKSKMINVKSGQLCSSIRYTDKTVWEWDEKIKEIADLKKKAGTCIAIVTVKEGTSVVATAIKILPPFKIPAEQIIGNAELKKLMGGEYNQNKDLTIIDNRPGDVFATGFIPGSINLPLPAIKDGTGLEKLPKDKNSLMVFYCGGLHCKLSPLSAYLVGQKGYKNIRVYHEGYPDWKAKGNPGYTNAAFVTKNIANKMPMILMDLRANAADGHIPGALAMKAKDLAKYKAQLPKGEDMGRAPFIIYGKDAADNKEAFALADEIIKLGYKNVMVLSGGFAEYAKAGQVVKSQLATSINYVHKDPPGYVSAKKFLDMIKDAIPAGMVLVDVREPGEIKDAPAMSILGAVNIPLGDLPAKSATMDKSKKYYLLCSSGTRAEMARGILAGKGLDAYYVAAPVDGDEADGISLGEKLKISPEQIREMKKKMLLKQS